MPGPRASRSPQAGSDELDPWLARHLADSAALLSPEEPELVLYLPPGLPATPEAIQQWASSAGLAVDFAVMDLDDAGRPVEDQGTMIRLRPAPALDDPP